MKKLQLVLLMSVLVMTIHAQEKRSIPAKVETVLDIPVFIFSIPAAEYEVVGKAVTTGHIIKVAVDESSTVSDKIEQIVEHALARKEKGKVPAFDAIIVDLNREKIQAITFTNEPSLDAIVLLPEEVPVYFFATPKGKYRVVDELPADFSLRAQRGLLLDKVESMMRRTLKKEEEGEVEKFDAVIINPDDLSEQLIVFE
jgi:hypothetical protein